MDERHRVRPDALMLVRSWLVVAALVATSCRGSSEPSASTSSDVVPAVSGEARVTASREPGQPSDTSLTAADCAEGDDQESVSDELRGVDRWLLATGPALPGGAVTGSGGLFVAIEFEDVSEVRSSQSESWPRSEIVVVDGGARDVTAGRRLAGFVSDYTGVVLLGVTARADFVDTAYAVLDDDTLVRLQSCGARAFDTADLLSAAEALGFDGTEIDLVTGLEADDVDAILDGTFDSDPPP